MMEERKRLIFIVLLPVLLFACAGKRDVVKQELNDQEKILKTEEILIEEKKQKEFEYLFVEAIKDKLLGNTQKAIQNLSGCLEIDPNSSAAMYELASIHAENNDFTSASLLLEKAISLNSQNKWYKLLLAEIYQKSKKFTEAAEIYEGLIEQEPENLEYLFRKANMLSEAGKVDEALETYTRLEDKVGINEQISIIKQRLFISEGEIDKAINEIQKLIEFDPKNPQYYGLMADLFHSEGDTVNALKYYKKIQEIDPDNGFVHFSLGNFYLQKGDIEKSFKEIEEGFRSGQIDLESKLQMFLMLTDKSPESLITPEQEDELINILLEVHPEEYLVHTVRAESLLKRNKLEEARAELIKTLELEKNDYMLWERVLFIDNDLQDWQKLYEHSIEAIDLFPNQPQVYFLNAVACIQLEKYDETVAISDEGLMYVVDNDQMKGRFLMLKGEAVYKTGKIDEAFNYFDESVKLDPDNHIALNNYAYYLSLAGKDLDKAERMSGLVIELFPDNTTYLDTYAWVLFKKGEYKLAKFYMESAMDKGGDENSTLLEHYGDILFKLEQRDEAIKYWQKAKDSGNNSEILERKISERKYFEE